MKIKEKLKEQQEQIDMLIEIVNNLVEREGDRQKQDRKIYPIHHLVSPEEHRQVDLQKVATKIKLYLN